jgi:hypothetical protein
VVAVVSNPTHPDLICSRHAGRVAEFQSGCEAIGIAAHRDVVTMGGETRVPEDLQLVGFDDVRFANLLTIPLTTMQQPCRDIALTAFNCIRERIASPSIPARSYHARPRK